MAAIDRRVGGACARTDTRRDGRAGAVNAEWDRQEPLRAAPLVRVPRTKAPGATNAMVQERVGVEKKEREMAKASSGGNEISHLLRGRARGALGGRSRGQQVCMIARVGCP